jgi:uncharacterized protein (TIGR00369 family)
MTKIAPDEFIDLVRRTMPMVARMGVELVEMGEGTANFRLPFDPDFLRPGGTISGPILMLLADLAMYGAVLSAIGPVELAVTTNLTINFLRKPPPGDLLVEANLLKLGRRLAVGEAALYAPGSRDMLAHATITYSIPPERPE